MRVNNEKELTYEEAKKYLSTSIVRYDINHHLANGNIKIFMHQDLISGAIPSASPFGSWIEMLLPFSRSPELADRFRKLHGDELRIGKLLELMDAIAADVAI